MLSIQNHFLDTNMILTIPFKGSNFNECRNYYKLKYKRYISYHVKDEAFDVIERMRLISLNMNSYIKKYMTSKSINLSNLDSHMQKIKKSYLNQFKDETHVFGVEKEKFIKIVGDLFIEYYDEIRTAIINKDTELESLSIKLKNAFNGYNKSVSICLSNFEKFSFKNNPNLINQIIDIGIHESDAILIDDCYNKAKDINEKFVFITQDKDIINCSQDVFKLLNSEIHFSKPKSFLNN